MGELRTEARIYGSKRNSPIEGARASMFAGSEDVGRMREFPPDVELTRGWDWYAVDVYGNLGYFATTELRRVPLAVKQNPVAAERTIDYFFKEAPRLGRHQVRPGIDKEVGGFESNRKRMRYLENFATMSNRGLFSFDSKLVDGFGRYYQVTAPHSPLRLSELPAETQSYLLIVQSPLKLGETVWVDEIETIGWPQART